MTHIYFKFPCKFICVVTTPSFLFSINYEIVLYFSILFTDNILCSALDIQAHLRVWMIFSFFDCFKSILFLEFHCTFSISYKILTNYVYYYCILFIIIIFSSLLLYYCTYFFFRARFTSYHTHASLLTFFVCFFILFHFCCSHAQVFGKTLVHEFNSYYSYTEWYLFFSDNATTTAQCVFGAKNKK